MTNGQLPWLYDDVEGQSGACEGPESSHDIGPAEPAFRLPPSNVTCRTPDEVLTARRCAQGVELSGHVRLEVDPANHTENRADRIGCRKQVECLAEHIHALDRRRIRRPLRRSVQLVGCAGRESRGRSPTSSRGQSRSAGSARAPRCAGANRSSACVTTGATPRAAPASARPPGRRDRTPSDRDPCVSTIPG